MKKAVLGLILSVTIMVVTGVVMLFSTGAFAQDAHGDPFFFVKRQLMWLGVGIVACFVGARVEYQFWQKTWKYWFGIAFVLLFLCFFTHKINGSHRWLKLGGFSFQPSEIGKLAAVAFLAAWFAEQKEKSREFLKGIVYPLLIVGVMVALIAKEPDLGTTALIGGTSFLVLFIAGARLFYLLPLPLMGVGGILYIATKMPERLGRLIAFMDLEKYKDGAGGQQYNGLIALGSGGVEGLGLGMGRQKMQFLPFAHTDFIFPMIGEELGLRFTLLIVFCYVVMIICGVAIALNSRDRFGMLFGFGIVVMFALQAAMNIGVTTALLPNKGITLPFISYGGSSLVFCLLGIGILLNIYRQGISERTVRVKMKHALGGTPRI